MCLEVTDIRECLWVRPHLTHQMQFYMSLGNLSHIPLGNSPTENVWKKEFPSRKDLKVIGRVFCLSYSKPANQNSSVMPLAGSFSPLHNLSPAHSSPFFLLKGSWLVRWIVFSFPCRLDSTIFFNIVWLLVWGICLSDRIQELWATTLVFFVSKYLKHVLITLLVIGVVMRWLF